MCLLFNASSQGELVLFTYNHIHITTPTTTLSSKYQHHDPTFHLDGPLLIQYINSPPVPP